MNRKASFNGISSVIGNLSDEEQLAIIDRPDEFKALVAKLAADISASTYFTALSDEEAIKWLVDSKKYLAKSAKALVAKYRKLATEMAHFGPVAWLVKAGFTLKTHAPKAGPCYKQFAYLQEKGWDFVDEPTKDCLAFWIPRLAPGSTGKSYAEQLILLGEVRMRLDLPKHHLSGLGSAALNAGLILANFKRVGERVPFDNRWVRTDTCRSDGLRLRLGDFGGSGLYCDFWGFDGSRNGRLGVFVLGVELVGS